MYFIAPIDAGSGFPPFRRTPSISKAIANLSVLLRSGRSTSGVAPSKAVSSMLFLALSSRVAVPSASHGAFIFSGGAITIGPLYRSHRLASAEDSLRTLVAVVDVVAAMVSTAGESFDIHSPL